MKTAEGKLFATSRRLCQKGCSLLVVLAFLAGFECSGLADEEERRPSGSQIPSEEFIASPFAEFFKAGDYPRALEALEALAKQHPDDPLIVRYRALVLDRLGRYDEALALYQQLLTHDPNHVPTRYFLAQTYHHKGEKEKAIGEWSWIVQNSPSKEYRQWAKEDLDRVGIRLAQPFERKRFYLFGNIGTEYDSNPLLKPNDKALATPGDEKQAERLSLNLGLGYRMVMRPDFRLDVAYTARQSFHTQDLDEVNFTSQELALDARKRVEIWNRDVTLGSRYDLRAGFLNSNLFSWDNQLTLSSDVRFTPRTRTYAYHRFTGSEFGPDGSNPPQTSRDGFYYDVGSTQYFYSPDFRRYLFIGEEFELAQTRGANFTRRGTSTRLGFHSPVPRVSKTDLDTSVGFRWGEYPRFVSLSSLDRATRVDNNWDFYVAFTHHITPRLATRLFYRQANANNRNDFFEYDRHVAGVQVLFTQYL